MVARTALGVSSMLHRAPHWGVSSYMLSFCAPFEWSSFLNLQVFIECRSLGRRLFCVLATLSLVLHGFSFLILLFSFPRLVSAAVPPPPFPPRNLSTCATTAASPNCPLSSSVNGIPLPYPSLYRTTSTSPEPPRLAFCNSKTIATHLLHAFPVSVTINSPCGLPALPNLTPCSSSTHHRYRYPFFVLHLEFFVPLLLRLCSRCIRRAVPIMKPTTIPMFDFAKLDESPLPSVVGGSLCFFFIFTCRCSFAFPFCQFQLLRPLHCGFLVS